MDCLTLDIGGTKTAAAWWHGDAMVLRREEPTPGDADGLMALLARMLSQAPAVQQVGAAITGTGHSFFCYIKQAAIHFFAINRFVVAHFFKTIFMKSTFYQSHFGYEIVNKR
jgi:hypothetical protein